MSQVIKAADALLLYNVTRKKYMANPLIRLKPDKTLFATPQVSSSATDAGIMLIVDVGRMGEVLYTGETFMLRSVTSQVGSHMYLGVDMTSNLGSELGNRVVFLPPINLRRNGWRAIPVHLPKDMVPLKKESSSSQSPLREGASREPPFRQRHKEPPLGARNEPLYYGVPYYIQFQYSEKNLLVSPNDSNLMVATYYSPEIYSEEWVFLPTTQLYTCQKDVEQCVQTRGTDNAYLPIQCKDQNCRNSNDERVFFKQQDCNSECGILPTESATQIATKVVAPSVTQSRTTADVTIIIVVGIIFIGVVIVLYSHFKSH